MKFKERTNKIISFMLAVVMTLSTITPAFTEVANAAVTTGNAEIITEYTDSGNPTPERETTGTDLDNFYINLSYGNIGSAKTGDTLNIKNASIIVPLTINIEYRGTQEYEAGALSFTWQDLFKGSYHPVAGHSVDVGAELKGSGSGRGDWYYVLSGGNYTFTNKNKTTGAFTSAVEILITLPIADAIISGSSIDFNSILTVGSLGNIESNRLYANLSTTHDEYTISEIYNPENNNYTINTIYTDVNDITYTTGGNTYNLSEYIPVRFFVNTDMIDNYRGTQYAKEIEEYKSYMTFTAPDDCIVSGYTDENKKNEVKFEWGYGTNLFRASGTSEKSGIHEFIVMFPAANYSTNDVIDVTAKIWGYFNDQYEYFESEMSSQVTVYYPEIITITGNISSGKYCSPKNMYLYDIEANNNIQELNYRLSMSGKNLGEAQESDVVIITDEYTTFSKSYVYGEGVTRVPAIDEYFLNTIEFPKEYFDNCSIELYLLDYETKEYHLYGTYSSNDIADGSSLIVDVTSEKVQHFKTVIKGKLAKLPSGTTSNNFLYIYVTATLNTSQYVAADDGMYIVNKADYQFNHNTIEYTASSYDYWNFKEKQVNAYDSIGIDDYSLKDNALIFPAGSTGGITISATTTDIPFEMYKSTQTITYPTYLDIRNLQIGLYPNIKNGPETATTYTLDTLPSYITYDYDIIDNGDGTSSFTITLYTDKDHPFIPYIDNTTYGTNRFNAGGYQFRGCGTEKIGSSYVYLTSIGSFFIGFDLAMDYDIYSALKVMAKLPSVETVNSTFTASKPDTNFENLTKWLSTSNSDSDTVEFPTLAGNTFQGVEKFVKPEIGNGYTKDLIVIDANGNYSYKLRVSGGETLLDSIVIYDNLEAAYGENEYWQGTFTGLDTSFLDKLYAGEDATYTVYYSADRSQAFDLATDGWVKADEWTAELSEVKSIAVDLGDFQFPSQSVAYVIVKMQAPAEEKTGVHAYNSYAADYKSYNSTTLEQLEDIKALESNIVEVMYNDFINYTVNKVWEGESKDSVEIKLLADSVVKETITLSADNNWTYTFTDLPALNSNKELISYTVEETSPGSYEVKYDTTVADNGDIATTVTNTRLDKYIYNIKKEWDNSDTKEKFVLGIIESSDLTEEEQKTLRANKTVIITASGNGLESITFKATADKNGLFTIPSTYSGYSNYAFTIKGESKVYNFSYDLEYIDSVVPDSITLEASDGNTVELSKENNWETNYESEVSGINFNEIMPEGWGSEEKNGLAITFSENCSFDDNTDMLYIYYYYNDTLYRTNAYYASTLPGQTIEIPATDFRIYLCANSSENAAYGFSIDSIKSVNVSTVIGSKYTSSMPSSNLVNVSGNNYPESAHNPYLAGNRTWHYTYVPYGENITISQVNDYNFDVNVLNTEYQIAKVVNTSITTEKYNFDITKEWNDVISLGYVDTFNVTEDEYKALVAGKTLSITAKGDGLADTVISVTADVNGNIVLDKKYNSYTSFSYEVKSGNLSYQFDYLIEKTEPVIPDSITLIPSDNVFDSEGNKISEVVLTKENNWTDDYLFENINTTFTEQPIDGWAVKKDVKNGLAITFNSNTRTYDSYDYIYIYYRYNGSLYRSSKYYGTNLAGKTISIPSTDFYLQFYSNAVNNNQYGLSIDSIKNVDVSTTLGSTTSSLPNYTPVEITGFNYPESAHNPYNGSTAKTYFWHYTYPVDNDATVVKNTDGTYSASITNVPTESINIISADVEVKKYDFNIEKDWVGENTNDMILGYNAASGLTEEEYKTMIADKTVTITATGDGLLDILFEATADSNGNISIPAEYKGHTNFSFEIEYNNKVYQFDYKVSRITPTIPDSITLIPSVSGYDEQGNEITEIVLTKENNWTTTVKFTDPTVIFKESEVEGWDKYEEPTGLAITFNDNCSSYSSTYGFVYIMYYYNGSLYRLGKYYGSGSYSLAGKTIEIPSTDFYIYWACNTTSSSYRNYYGFKVDDIKPLTGDVSASGTVITALPTTAPTEVSGTNYPETTHYLVNSGFKMWHYTGNPMAENINITQNGEDYTVSVNNTAAYTYSSTVTVNNKEFTYNIEKQWKFEDTDFTIGYLSDSGFSEEEYKALVAGKTLNITASGDGLNSTTFEATADENGNIVIPAQYGSYTTLTFQVLSNNSAYNFTYNVSKTQPTIPDAIKLYSSDGSTIILKKSEGWTTEYVSEIMNLQFAEELGQTTGEILDALSSISNDYGISLANDIIIDDDVIIEGGDVIIGGETVTLVDYTIKNYLSGALISSVDYSTDTTNTTYATIFAEIENNLATFATQNDCKLISYTVKNASGVVVNSTDTISSGKLTVEANYEPNTGLGGSAVMIFYDGDLQGSFDTTRSDYSELFEHLEEEAQKFAQQEGAIYDGILVTDLDGKEIKSTDPITDLDVLVYVNLLIGPEIGVEQFTVRISISGENVSDNFTVDTQEKYYELPFQMIENRIQDKGYDQDPYYTGYKVIDSMTGKEAKPSDSITGGTLQVQLQYSNPLEDYESEVSVEKVDDYNYNVKVVNTGKYIYNSVVKVSTNENITITKEWIIPEDFIKLNIKDTLGYEGDYEKVEILNKAGTVLETIVKPDEAGLLVSANKYTITETYTAKIYMADGAIKTATINGTPFELVPVEVEIFDGETSLGVFELNEENNWQATVSVPANAELTIKEITTGNWTYEVNDTVITNTVNQEIEITDITVPVPGEIIDTGNDALPTYVLVIFFTGLAGLATSLLLSRKKKNR